MDKSVLLNDKLPLVTEYNDKYENTVFAEVVSMAEDNDPIALYELAYRYRCGEQGAPQDIVKAMELYQKVLEFQRNTAAMYRLGYAYQCGDLGEERQGECLVYYEAAVELGDPDSAVQLGIIYEYGNLVPQDYDKALELYLWAIDKGRKDAYYYAGEIYRYRGMNEKAIEYYNLALENGELQALLPLGWYYQDGIVLEKDDKKALECYEKAYEEGNPDSIISLGKMYYYGLGTITDDKRAFELFLEASEKGYKAANYFLGTMYGYGVEGVVEKDFERALEYLSDVSASYEGASWYIKGCLYAKRNETEEALVWLTKALEAGEERAAKVIEELKNPPKTLKELAEEGKDPKIMMQYAAVALTDKENGDFHAAVETMERANRLFPDNLEVKEMYARFIFLKGHISFKIGALDEAYKCLRMSLDAVDQLKRHNFMMDEVRETEVDACYELAKLAYQRDEGDYALQLLARTDIQKWPYAASLKTLIHMSDLERFDSCIKADVAEIQSVLGSSRWESAFEEASAYFSLSIIYAHGIYGYIPANVPYAYECIKKCASLDEDLAQDELKKYSKGLFGKISYRK